jgi:patatin-like phospholipase/acyl hydrolase
MNDNVKVNNILSISGGGIRGIIPCCCLVALESQLGGVTRDHIQYCAGTSTGALLTAAVGAGIPASELLKVYTDRSSQIFTPTGVIADAKRIAEGFMYDPKNLHAVLVSVFGAAASWAVNDSPIPLMISATAVNGHNWFFVKDNPKNSQTTGKVILIDAAVASSCAPTYFNCWPIDGILRQTTIYLFDGGAGGTANPIYQACVEAFDYDDMAAADSRIVSLGTGYYPASDTPPKDLLNTINWATDTLVDTSEDWMAGAVGRQWPDLSVQTFNPPLPSDIGMADLSAIPALVKVGQELADAMDWSKILMTAGPGATLAVGVS